MLLSNPFRPDPRVLKEARTLIRAGHKVSILCWDRSGDYRSHELVEGIDIYRFHIRSKYSAGSRQILYLPQFWVRAFVDMLRLHPDIIHCHDLDTTIPGFIYARTLRIPWVFDAHECYPEQIKPQVHQSIYKGLIQLEKFISPRATTVITVGELLAERFRSFGARTEIVGNYPDLTSYNSLSMHISRQSMNIPPKDLIVAYIGGFTKAREILPLIESSRLVPDTTLLLAGDGPQRPAIEAVLPRFEKVKYIGWIPQDMVPTYTSLIDVIYYGLNSSDGNSHFSTPNALFNAMAAGKPLITTDVGEIAHIVRKINCGLVIPEATPEQIASAITQLKNETLRNQLSNNANNVSITKYNWEHAQNNLLTIYEQLL